MNKDEAKLMRVGELAKAVGKTVRAMHLYEELGLLEPRARSEGGFRLYGPEAVDRIHWIVKLQAIGFTLAEIQGFVRDFQGAGSGREATERVRALFQEKQAQIRSDDYAPAACGSCDHHGHLKGEAPPLFAGLSRPNAEVRKDDKAKDYDVPVTVLYREGNN
jgi:DNA-binding transcriptional MerR regulator